MQDESLWHVVFSAKGYEEAMKAALELSDKEVQTPLKISLFRTHSLLEKCCEVLRTTEEKGILPLRTATVPVQRNKAIPEEVRLRYIQCGNNATAKLAVLQDEKNVQILMNRMLFALDTFFQIVLMDKRQRPLRYRSDNKWGPLWSFSAPLTIHKTLPYHSLYQEVMWLALHNQLSEELLPARHTIIWRQYTLWLEYVMTLMDGVAIRLIPPPYLRLLPGCETPQFPGSFVFAQENGRPIPELRKWARSKMRKCLAQGEVCTYHVTGPSFNYLQPQWACLTCGYGMENHYFICHNCALQHDSSHRLLFRGIAAGYCDKGA